MSWQRYFVYIDDAVFTVPRETHGEFMVDVLERAKRQRNLVAADVTPYMAAESVDAFVEKFNTLRSRIPRSLNYLKGGIQMDQDRDDLCARVWVVHEDYRRDYTILWVCENEIIR